MPGNSQDLELIKLQIEKQRLEIQVLELEAQAKARSLSSARGVKPVAIPSLDRVRFGHNAGSIKVNLSFAYPIRSCQEHVQRSHVRLGATAPCLYHIHPYNSIDTSTFPTIVFCSTLKIGPYLFYIEKFTTQFKTTENKIIGHRSRFRENDDLPLRRGPVVKKKPLFSNARALITRKIMRIRDGQCTGTGE